MEEVAAKLAHISTGTWKLDVARSKRTPPSPNPTATLIVVNEAADNGIQSTVTGRLTDGTMIHFAGTIRFDGKEHPIAGAPWDTYSFTLVDDHTCTFVNKKAGGKLHVLGRQSISEDGQTMTITSEGIDNDGLPIAGLQIYEKVIGP